MLHFNVREALTRWLRLFWSECQWCGTYYWAAFIWCSALIRGTSVIKTIILSQSIIHFKKLNLQKAFIYSFLNVSLTQMKLHLCRLEDPNSMYIRQKHSRRYFMWCGWNVNQSPSYYCKPIPGLDKIYAEIDLYAMPGTYWQLLINN